MRILKKDRDRETEMCRLQREWVPVESCITHKGKTTTQVVSSSWTPRMGSAPRQQLLQLHANEARWSQDAAPCTCDGWWDRIWSSALFVGLNDTTLTLRAQHTVAGQREREAERERER